MYTILYKVYYILYHCKRLNRSKDFCLVVLLSGDIYTNVSYDGICGILTLYIYTYIYIYIYITLRRLYNFVIITAAYRNTSQQCIVYTIPIQKANDRAYQIFNYIERSEDYGGDDDREWREIKRKIRKRSKNKDNGRGKAKKWD